MHPPARVQLPLVQVRLTPGAWHPQDRHRADRVQVGDDEGRLEGSCWSYIAWSIAPARSMRAERIHGPVVDHDPAIRINLPHLLKLTAADLQRFDPNAHRLLADRWP